MADVRDAVVDALPGRPDLPRVLGVCSVLLGDRPVGAAAAPDVHVPAGTTWSSCPPSPAAERVPPVM